MWGGANIATVLNFPRILKLRGQKVATVLNNKKQDLRGNGCGGIWGGGAKMATVLKFPRILKLRGQTVATVLKKQKKLRFEGKWPWGRGSALLHRIPSLRAVFLVFGGGAEEPGGKQGATSSKLNCRLPAFPWLPCFPPGSSVWLPY